MKYVATLPEERCDLPGHSAEFCAYVAMDHDTFDNVALEVIDKRETDLKSPNMDPLALDRALTGLNKGFTVEEVATNGHTQVPHILWRETVWQDESLREHFQLGIKAEQLRLHAAWAINSSEEYQSMELENFQGDAFYCKQNGCAEKGQK